MRSKQTCPRSSHFKTVQKQFEAWRKTRTRRSPIPESLWKSAVSLVKDHSLYTVSKSLHLNYAALKQRSYTDSAGVPSSKADQPKFIELGIPTSSFSASPVLEVAKPDGTTIRLLLQGLSTKDLFNLARSFWIQGS